MRLTVVARFITSPYSCPFQPFSVNQPITAARSAIIDIQTNRVGAWLMKNVRIFEWVNVCLALVWRWQLRILTSSDLHACKVVTGVVSSIY